MKSNDFFRNKIYFLQLLSAILVVYIHTFKTKNLSMIPLSYNVEYFLSCNIATLAVPLFFAISGFLFFQNFDISMLLDKWKKRIFTVLIPYFVWNIIYLIYFYVVTRTGITNEKPVALSAKNILESIFLFKYNEVFWYMFQLIIFIALVPLLYYVLKNKYTGFVFLAGLIILYSLDIDGALKDTFVRNNISDSLFYYSLGAYLGINYKNEIKNENGRWYIGIITFVLSQILVYIPVNGNAIFLFSRLLLMISAFYLSNIADFKMKEILICSFPIYTVHELILQIFNKVFSIIIPDNSNLILIYYFISPIVTVLIIIFAVYFIKKKMPFLYSVLWGKR